MEMVKCQFSYFFLLLLLLRRDPFIFSIMGNCLPTIYVVYEKDSRGQPCLSYEYADSKQELPPGTIYGMQLAYVKKFCRTINQTYEAFQNAGASVDIQCVAEQYLIQHFGEPDLRMFMRSKTKKSKNP